MTTATLWICTTCRRGTGDEPRPGARLLSALQALDIPPDMEIRGVECLSACSNGCAAALSGPDKWTYIYGGLDPDADPPEILRGAALYARSMDGLTPWRERPEAFRRNVLGRTPPTGR